MTTALQIINRAAEWAGYKDPSESLDGTDSANYLAALNDMVGSWNNHRLFVPTTTTVSASVSASPVSIGEGQTLDTARPTRISDGWVRDGGIDYPIKRWLTASEYDAISNKSATADYPEWAYYSPGVPHGSIYLWPAPAHAIELHVRVMAQLSSFAGLSTDYDLGQGYKRALEFSLAEEIWPNRITPKMAQLAASARRSLKVANFESVKLEGSDVAHSRRFNILTGE